MAMPPIPPERASETAVCPDCGAERITFAAVPCWLCGAMLPPLAGPTPGPGPRRPKTRPAEGPDHPVLSTLLTIVILVVGVGVLNLAPGLGMLLVILAVPVLMALWAPSRSSVLRNVVVVVGTLIAAGVAGFVTFFVFCFWAFTEGMGNRSDRSEAIFIGGVIAAIAVAILILFTLSRTLRPKE